MPVVSSKRGVIGVAVVGISLSSFIVTSCVIAAMESWTTMLLPAAVSAATVPATVAATALILKVVYLYIKINRCIHTPLTYRYTDTSAVKYVLNVYQSC